MNYIYTQFSIFFNLIYILSMGISLSHNLSNNSISLCRKTNRQKTFLQGSNTKMFIWMLRDRWCRVAIRTHLSSLWLWWTWLNEAFSHAAEELTRFLMKPTLLTSGSQPGNKPWQDYVRLSPSQIHWILWSWGTLTWGSPPSCGELSELHCNTVLSAKGEYAIH